MNKKESKVSKMRRPRLAESKIVRFLQFLMGMADNFMVCLDKKELYRRVYGFDDSGWSNIKTSKVLNDLMRRGYIERENDGFVESIKFTMRSKLALIDKIIIEDSGNESCYYFVSFDIPERLRQNRDQFRRSIKKIGFREVQKSLWVCNRSVGQFIEELTEYYGISDYVVYIVSKASNIDNSLAKLVG